MVDDEADHGFFLDAQILLDLLGDPRAHDSLNDCVLFQTFIGQREAKDFFFCLGQSHVYLFVLGENLRLNLFLGLFTLGSLLRSVWVILRGATACRR